MSENNDAVKQVLVAARARLQDPKAWTKGADGRDADGKSIGPYPGRLPCVRTGHSWSSPRVTT